MPNIDSLALLCTRYLENYSVVKDIESTLKCMRSLDPDSEELPPFTTARIHLVTPLNQLTSVKIELTESILLVAAAAAGEEFYAALTELADAAGEVRNQVLKEVSGGG